MIFLGDTAHPFNEIPSWANMKWPWEKQAVIVNLEGAIASNSEELLNKRVLFNVPSVIQALKKLNTKAVCLANNHITDIKDGITNTKDSLKAHDILSFGAGNNAEEAALPVEINENGQSYILIGAGWQTIQCKEANNSQGVNILSPDQLFKQIELVKKNAPGSAVILFLHWNYEMELYPQPAHRQLAFDLVDAGVDAVIGHHPHCVGGIEIYKSCPIAYSLGNWWLPQDVFFNNKLRYCEMSELQLALEWTCNEEPLLHWFLYKREDHQLEYLDSEYYSKSGKIKELTPYDGMSHDEYIAWFRKHRKKRKALPIYKDYRQERLNKINNSFVKLRQYGIKVLETIGVRS